MWVWEYETRGRVWTYWDEERDQLIRVSNEYEGSKVGRDWQREQPWLALRDLELDPRYVRHDPLEPPNAQALNPLHPHPSATPPAPCTRHWARAARYSRYLPDANANAKHAPAENRVSETRPCLNGTLPPLPPSFPHTRVSSLQSLPRAYVKQTRSRPILFEFGSFL